MCGETEVTFSAQRVKGRGEEEMVGSSQSSSVKRSSEDKQPSRPCIRGSAKISWLVSQALRVQNKTRTMTKRHASGVRPVKK